MKKGNVNIGSVQGSKETRSKMRHWKGVMLLKNPESTPTMDDVLQDLYRIATEEVPKLENRIKELEDEE